VLVKIPELDPPEGKSELIKKQSRLHYGRPRQEVEEKIMRVLQPEATDFGWRRGMVG
jgi:hypothetical protein